MTRYTILLHQLCQLFSSTNPFVARNIPYFLNYETQNRVVGNRLLDEFFNETRKLKGEERFPPSLFFLFFN